jgi:PleD family two-component response regulator
MDSFNRPAPLPSRGRRDRTPIATRREHAPGASAIVNRLQSIIRYVFCKFERFLAQRIMRLWTGWGAAMDIADANTTDAARIRVLFVEDEFFIREWIAQSLSEQGFAVDSVTNAVDALLHITRAPIDVLLTDINLPGGMDGTALARRARELQPDLAVI